MEKRYSPIHAPVWSFFSAPFHDDVARAWRGKAFAYLFTLLAVTWALSLAYYGVQLRGFALGEGRQYIRQAPKIKLAHGKIAIDRPEPYYIRNAATKKTFAIIDTTGKITSLDNEPDAVLLLTRTQLIASLPAFAKMPPLDLDTGWFQDAEADAKAIDRFFREDLGAVCLGLFVIFLAFSTVYRVLQAMLFGAVAMNLAAAMGRTLDYNGAVRLAVMAITPVILLDTALHLFVPARVGTAGWAVMCFAIEMIYLFFGVLSIGVNDENAATKTAPPPRPL
jgi:hypothetical protein